MTSAHRKQVKKCFAPLLSLRLLPQLHTHTHITPWYQKSHKWHQATCWDASCRHCRSLCPSDGRLIFLTDSTQQTFLTLNVSSHLLWPQSETLTSTEASKLLQSLHRSVSLTYDRPLCPRTSHQFHTPPLLYPPLFYRPPHLLLLLFFILPSSTTLSNPFSCVECLPFHLQKQADSFTLLCMPNLHTDVTPRRSVREKREWERAREERRKKRWCGWRGKGTFLQLL